MKDEGTEQALKEMVSVMFLNPEERDLFQIKEIIKRSAMESWKIYLEERGEICSWDTQLVYEYAFYAGIECAFQITNGKP